VRCTLSGVLWHFGFGNKVTRSGNRSRKNAEGAKKGSEWIAKTAGDKISGRPSNYIRTGKNGLRSDFPFRARRERTGTGNDLPILQSVYIGRQKHQSFCRNWRVWLSAWTLYALFWSGTVVLAGDARAAQIDAPAQEQVNQILQRVIESYWNNGEAKITAATNAPGSDTNVEAAFRAASKLLPERLDLRFGIASALVSQAVQTNGPQLELKLAEALGVYRDIEALDTNGFESPLLLAAYTRVLLRTNESASALGRLMSANPERTRAYLRMFDRIDKVLGIQPSDIPEGGITSGSRHAIVVLGAGLETNGLAKPKMAARLEQCLRLAQLYPAAPIILTGGNARGGITEAYAMQLWCVGKGLASERLWMEDESRDTVENALFTSALLQKLSVTEVTLVTSTSHLRRGLADLQEACLKRGLTVRFHQLAARIKGDVDLDPTQERLGVYRDALRLTGIWAFPGLRR
jgi:uncharacterized SAM-binding protein YcdF (DUF218 family)